MTDAEGLVEAVAADIYAEMCPFRGSVSAYDNLNGNAKNVYRNYARAALSAISAAGWQVVPVKPTEEMSNEGWDAATAMVVTARR